MKIANKFIQRHLTMPVRNGIKRLSPQITCADDTKLSVQASDGHYCTPKSNFGPYSSVEILYPNTDDVSGWVPVSQVVEFINNHGGVK